MCKRSKGCFIVIEGADGVGKSTVLKLIMPKLLADKHFSGVRFFHWKPVKGGIHDGGIPETEAQNPRGKEPRNVLFSLLYLTYHWLTFWTGYLRFVCPAKKRGMLVIADRYTYDVLLDPHRFRLNVPTWALRLFVKTLPHPDKTVAFVAEPETIVARKHELTVDEIKTYQKGLKSGNIPNVRVIDAEAVAEIVADEAYRIILGTERACWGGRDATPWRPKV